MPGDHRRLHSYGRARRGRGARKEMSHGDHGTSFPATASPYREERSSIRTSSPQGRHTRRRSFQHNPHAVSDQQPPPLGSQHLGYLSTCAPPPDNRLPLTAGIISACCIKFEHRPVSASESEYSRSATLRLPNPPSPEPPRIPPRRSLPHGQCPQRRGKPHQHDDHA